MRFFDSKEEVLDIQLTQVGKRKLARGRFRPYYYAFFDDDILYNVARVGVTEEQNSSVPRILDETPRMRVQYTHRGADASYNKVKAQKMLGKEADNKVMNKNSPHVPMGTSVGNEYLPAWSVRFAGDDAKIESFNNNYSGSWGISPVPQISSSLTVETRVEFQEELITSVLLESTGKEMGLIDGRPLYDPAKSTGVLSTEAEPDVYPDGSYIVTVQPSMLLDVSELNNEFTNENFDVEIFEILTELVGSSTTDKEEILRPLKFSSTADPYSRSELLSEDVIMENPDFVGHYVEAFVDGELGQQAIDKLLGRKSVGANTVTGPSPYRSGGDDKGQLNPDDLKEPC